MRPPVPVFWLTLAVTLPFLLGAVMALGFWPGEGRALVAAFGAVTLFFLSGTLWGYAAKSGARWWALALALLPAAYVFFFVQRHPWALEGQALSHLIAGFLGISVLDVLWQARGLAPRWWLALRLPANAVALAALWVARGA